MVKEDNQMFEVTPMTTIAFTASNGQRIAIPYNKLQYIAEHKDKQSTILVTISNDQFTINVPFDDALKILKGIIRQTKQTQP